MRNTSAQESYLFSRLLFVVLLLCATIFALLTHTSKAQSIQVPSDLWLSALYFDGGSERHVLDALDIAIQVVNNSTDRIYQPFLNRNLRITWHLNSTIRPTTPQESVMASRDSFFLNNLTVGAIGPALSSHAIVVSNQVGSVLQKPVVCYASTAHGLGIAKDHPYFTRTIPSDSLQSAAMLDFIYVHEFARVGAIASDDAYGVSGIQEFEEIGKRKDVYLRASNTFPSGDITSIQNGLQNLKNQGISTIVCFILEFSDIMLVLEKANEMNMLHRGYVWIMSDTFNDGFVVNDMRNITGLTQSQMELVQGLIYIGQDPGTFTKRRVLVEEWRRRNLTLPISTYSYFAYDVVSLYARAAANTIRLQKNVFNGTILMDEILKSDFLGVSGRIKFDKDHDRIGVAYEINNIQGTQESMVSFWNTETGLNSLSLDILLPGNVKYEQPDDGGLRLEIKDGGPKRWNPIPAKGQPPPSRDSHGIGIHEGRDTLIIFGGFINSKQTVSNDLWYFNFKDAIWTRIYPMSPQVPSPRQEFVSWVIDDYYYIFGGYDLRYYLNDMWRYNMRTQQWQQIPTPVSIPSSRRAARSVLHGRVVYMHGGEDQQEVQDDIWMYNVDSNLWTEIEPSGASPLGPARADACVSFHENRLIVIAGSYVKENYNDLWTFSIDTKVWKKEITINLPSVRNDMMCAKLGDYLYYGLGIGGDLEELNDFYRIRLDFSQSMTWEKIYSEMPEGHKKRDATYAGVYDNLIVWYGGSGEGGAFSDLHIYDVYEKLFEKIHGSMYVPSPRSSHISSIIGNNIVVWGGVDDEGKALNSMEQFNIDVDVWSPIVPSGDTPPPRYNTLAVPIGDRIYIFFGQSDRITYLEDIWVYSYIFNEWNEVQSQSEIHPTPRAGMTGQPFANDSMIIIYGGSNLQNLFDEVWLFDLQTNEWIKYEAGGISPDTFVNNADSDLSDDEIFYVFGGSDRAGDSDPFAHFLDLKTGNWTRFDTPMARTRSTITTISNDTLLLFGGSNSNILYNDLFLGVHSDSLNFKTMDVSTSLNVPGKRDAHTGEYFGNEYFIFGGYGPVVGPTPYRSESVVYSNMYSFRYGSLCVNGTYDGSCIFCSPGTYQFRQSCISCPKGYFNADFDFECDPCPKGFYSKIEGSDTILMCSPCSFGTYNDEPGQETCKPCPKDKYCPIGSTEPLEIPERKIEKIGTPESKQPLPLQGKDFRNTILNIVSFATIGAIGFLVFMVLLCISKTKYGGKGLTIMDFFFTKYHSPDPNNRVMVYKTKYGGVFTIICLLFLIAFSVTTIIPAIDDNLEESRSLIPNLTIKKTPVTSSFTIIVHLGGYQAECSVGNSGACAPRIAIQPTSLFVPQPTSQRVICEETNIKTTRAGMDRACKVTYQCIDCHFENSNIARVDFNFLEPNTYAYEIQYDVRNSAGYPDQESTIKGYVLSDDNAFFRGTSRPTTILLESIQTTYSVLSTNQTLTGFHLDFQRINLGDEVDSRIFNYRNGIHFRVLFERSPSSLEVELRTKLGYPGIILTIIGGLSGVIGIFAGIMYQCENIDEKLSDFLEKRKQKMETPSEKGGEKDIEMKVQEMAKPKDDGVSEKEEEKSQGSLEQSKPENTTEDEKSIKTNKHDL